MVWTITANVYNSRGRLPTHMRMVDPDGNPVYIPDTGADYPHRDAEIVREMYEDEGMSIREIAKELNASKESVRNTMIRNNIERRPPRRYTRD